MRFCLPLVLYLLCSSTSAYAGNWLVPSAYNQLTSGRFCGQVKEQELEQLTGACRAKGLNLQSLRATESVADMVHNVVFEEAALRQLKIDECLAQSLDLMKNNAEKRDKWAETAGRTWLSFKKVKLIREQCLAIDHHNAMGKAIPRELKQFASTCENPNSYEAMFNAERLYSFTIPILSDPRIFDVVESNRDLIINKATGKPFTDSEILAINMDNDLTPDGKFIDKFKPKFEIDKKGMSEALGPLLDESIKHRHEAFSRLNAAKKAGNLQNLDRDLRDYLYEQGVVKDVMIDRGILNISDAAEVKKTTYGANCIMAWYEPTLGGELVDMAAMSAVGAGPASKALKAAAPVLKSAEKVPLIGKYIAKMASPLASVGHSKLAAGLFVGAAGDSTKQVYKNCFADLKDTSRLKNMNADDKVIGVQSNALPDQIGYERWNVPFKDSEVPACTAQDKDQNYAMNAQYHANCVREALLAILPMQLIPFAFLTPE